ncbi:hypothetical protein PCL_04227 [Purpureocillium lilacinum]|uniref:Uncharacterized protein n=1 Tax=Purpureocillium lilacinum TaxID=33203 RepID=A0A2U3ERA9_PURLI|nr:hypothetical protein PCL_04227 [Purpureocillium lilacinum]
MHTAFSQQKELVALPVWRPTRRRHPPPARHTRTTTSPSLPAGDNKAHPLFSTPVLPSARVLSPPSPDRACLLQLASFLHYSIISAALALGYYYISLFCDAAPNAIPAIAPRAPSLLLRRRQSDPTQNRGGGSPAHARTHATQTHTTCTKKLPLAGAPPKERMFAGDLVLIQPAAAAARRQRPRSESIPLRVLRHDGSDARAGGPRGWSFARDEGPTGARSTRSSSDSSGVRTAAVEARRGGTPKQRQAATGGKP